MRRLFAAAFCMVILFGSCGEKDGSILPAPKMQAVMWDIFQADAYTERFIKKDSSKNEFLSSAAYQQKIFQLHNTTREAFYRSYDYYNSRPDVMRVILDSIAARAERERNGLMMDRYSGGHGSRPERK